jgi:hypothetical protein
MNSGSDQFDPDEIINTYSSSPKMQSSKTQRVEAGSGVATGQPKGNTAAAGDTSYA